MQDNNTSTNRHLVMEASCQAAADIKSDLSKHLCAIPGMSSKIVEVDIEILLGCISLTARKVALALGVDIFVTRGDLKARSSVYVFEEQKNNFPPKIGDSVYFKSHNPQISYSGQIVNLSDKKVAICSPAFYSVKFEDRSSCYRDSNYRVPL